MKRLLAFSIVLLAAAGCRSSLDTVVSINDDDLTPDAPQTGRVVVADSRTWGNDAYDLNSIAITGDRLTIDVSYGGGCRTHAFTLVLAPSFAESDPVQLTAELAHEAQGDPCQAWLTEQYVFDLELVRTRYRETYGPGPATVVLQIAGAAGNGLVYEFTA
jgi:hypothetical protein